MRSAIKLIFITFIVIAVACVERKVPLDIEEETRTSIFMDAGIYGEEWQSSDNGFIIYNEYQFKVYTVAKAGILERSSHYNRNFIIHSAAMADSNIYVAGGAVIDTSNYGHLEIEYRILVFEEADTARLIDSLPGGGSKTKSLKYRGSHLFHLAGRGGDDCLRMFGRYADSLILLDSIAMPYIDDFEVYGDFIFVGSNENIYINRFTSQFELLANLDVEYKIRKIKVIEPYLYLLVEDFAGFYDELVLFVFTLDDFNDYSVEPYQTLLLYTSYSRVAIDTNYISYIYTMQGLQSYNLKVTILDRISPEKGCYEFLIDEKSSGYDNMFILDNKLFYHMTSRGFRYINLD